MLKKHKEVKATSKRLQRLSVKHSQKMNYYLHNISASIMNHAVCNGINTIILGYNKSWKQDIRIGKVNTQKFVSIPFYRFVQQIQYKAKRHGIRVIITEESYTSKCSFLDREDLRKHDKYAGRRVKRGLFKSATGTLVNADVNGAGNIMRKVVPDAYVYANGIEAGAVQPCTVDYLSC